MSENFIKKEGCLTSKMVDEHSTAFIKEKDVDISNIGEFVMGEANSSIITFTINRFYDGVDLSEKTIKVIFRNQNGTYDDEVYNIEYSDERLRFSWILSSEAVRTKTTIAFIAFISENYLMKTKSFKIQPTNSFDIESSEPSTNWFVTIEGKLTKIEKDISDIRNFVNEEIDVKLSELQEQFPTKVSDLTNDSMVSFSEQELTDEQKQQALDNIGTARYQKCELTYKNKPITIYLKDGSITRPLDDASDEVKTVWSTFVQKINTTLTVGNMPWSFRKSILSAFLNANLNGIIPDTFSYYGDAYYKKLIVFSRYKDNDGKYIATYTYDNKGKYARIAQYVDTGEYLSNISDAKTETPIVAYGSYQVGDDSVSVNQFNLSSDPTSDMQVATKQYVDKNTVSTSHNIETKIDKIIKDGVYTFDSSYPYAVNGLDNFIPESLTVVSDGYTNNNGMFLPNKVTQILTGHYNSHANKQHMYMRTCYRENTAEVNWYNWCKIPTNEQNVVPINHVCNITSDTGINNIVASGVYTFNYDYDKSDIGINDKTFTPTTLIVFSDDSMSNGEIAPVQNFCHQILIGYTNLTSRIFIRYGYPDMISENWQSWIELTQTTTQQKKLFVGVEVIRNSEGDTFKYHIENDSELEYNQFMQELVNILAENDYTDPPVLQVTVLGEENVHEVILRLNNLPFASNEIIYSCVTTINNNLTYCELKLTQEGTKYSETILVNTKS